MLTPQDDLQRALDAASPGDVLLLDRGVFRCKLTLSVPGVTLRGRGAGRTVLVWDDYARKRDARGFDLITFRTFTLAVCADGVTLEDLTVANDAGDPRERGQQVALSVCGDGFTALRCTFSSTQDTLFLGPLPADLIRRYEGFLPDPLRREGPCRQTFRECLIQGTVDFIFGCGQALFDRCELRSLPDARGTGYLAAPAHPRETDSGFLFRRCRLTAAPGVAPGSVYLARPWREWGMARFQDCVTQGDHIAPQGFAPWPGTRNHLTARFSASPPLLYRNPILMMDLSDPDVIRVGEDYYLVASSFTYLPGVPLLHSRDMVHWQRLAWCVPSLPFDRYALPAHGCGAWAPSIRFHDGLFYVFVPLPDEGIFVTTARDPAGPWAPLRPVWEGAGRIDPCPFWDDDGRAYLVHAYANSRCGIKHRIDVVPMAPDASRLLGPGVTVFCDPDVHPTMEGPKMHKRDGWYYIFAPAGGVSTGWQTVLRARDPLGPYEARTVMAQGDTPVNGPHQGAWVTAPDGSDWFYHFQDLGVYGRVLHLQPMVWREGWPVIGADPGGTGVGQPVARWPLPADPVLLSLDADDDFPGPELSLPWQWQADPQPRWCRVDRGLTLPILPCPRGESLLWYMPNVLSQTPQWAAFTLEAQLTLDPRTPGDEAGIAVLGHRYSALALHSTGDCLQLRLYRGEVTDPSPRGVAREEPAAHLPWDSPRVTLRLHFARGGLVSYDCLTADGGVLPLPGSFPAAKSAWSGARPALFARNTDNAPGGAACFHRVRFLPCPDG